MTGKHLDIDIDTFNRRLRREGWKYEYYDNQAHITSAEQTVVVRLDPSALPTGDTAPSRLKITSWSDPGDELIEAAYGAFEDTMDYCDWPNERIRTDLAESIAKWRAAEAPEGVKDASRLAWEDASGRLLGALLVSIDRAGTSAKVYLLFVRPGTQRKGIATALLLDAWHALEQAPGRPRLRSAYALGNRSSAAWHRASGFREEPDLVLTLHRRNIALHNMQCIGPHDRTGRVERARYAAQLAHYEAELAVMEQVASDADAYAVAPILSY